jgi:hypothetical protein
MVPPTPSSRHHGGNLGGDIDVVASGAARNFPLTVSPDAAVTAAIKRDARVIGQHMSYLNR